MMARQLASKRLCKVVNTTPGVCKLAHTRSTPAATLTSEGSTLPEETKGLWVFATPFGPLEMTIDTALPAATEVLAAGAWLATRLYGVTGLTLRVTAPKVKPAACRVIAAAVCVSPTTLGTLTPDLTESEALAPEALAPKLVCKAPGPTELVKFAPFAAVVARTLALMVQPPAGILEPAA